MKNRFTVKDVMDGTGLTRQRIHQLVKGWGIEVRKKNNRLLLTWNDLLSMADNPTILCFLKDTLDKERRLLDKACEEMERNKKVVEFGRAVQYARILLDGHPEIDSHDHERWSRWFEAGEFFTPLLAVKNPAYEEPNKE